MVLHVCLFGFIILAMEMGAGEIADVTTALRGNEQQGVTYCIFPAAVYGTTPPKGGIKPCDDTALNS